MRRNLARSTVFRAKPTRRLTPRSTSRELAWRTTRHDRQARPAKRSNRVPSRPDVFNHGSLSPPSPPASRGRGRRNRTRRRRAGAVGRHNPDDRSDDEPRARILRQPPAESDETVRREHRWATQTAARGAAPAGRDACMAQIVSGVPRFCISRRMCASPLAQRTPAWDDTQSSAPARTRACSPSGVHHQTDAACIREAATRVLRCSHARLGRVVAAVSARARSLSEGTRCQSPGASGAGGPHCFLSRSGSEASPRQLTSLCACRRARLNPSGRPLHGTSRCSV